MVRTSSFAGAVSGESRCKRQFGAHFQPTTQPDAEADAEAEVDAEAGAGEVEVEVEVGAADGRAGASSLCSILIRATTHSAKSGEQSEGGREEEADSKTEGGTEREV